MTLAVVDWIALGVLLGSIALGLWRGVVYELISVAGYIAAFLGAQWLAGTVALHLPDFLRGWSPSVRHAIAFGLVFIALVFAAGLLGWALKKAVAAMGLGASDRTLGAAFGLLRGLVLLLAAALVIGWTPMERAAWWRDSLSAPVLSAALRGMRPALEFMGLNTRFMDPALPQSR